MRDGGIVKYKIFVFYNPSPPAAELPLHKGAFLFLCLIHFFCLFALKTAHVCLFPPRNVEDAPQQRREKARGSHQNDLHISTPYYVDFGKV